MTWINKIPPKHIGNLFDNWRGAFPLFSVTQPSVMGGRTPSIAAALIATAVLFLTPPCMRLLAADSHAPQPQNTLEQMLKITWKKGPDLPVGFQDSAGGIMGSKLISVAGACGTGGGQKNVPGKPARCPSVFLKKLWELDLSQPKASWVELPEFPGVARQGLHCAAISQKLYCWGGINYTAPFTYKDGYRLSKQAERWAWDPLPDMPSPVAFSGICALGSKIYVFGGSDFNHKHLYTHADRNGNNKRLGARLLAIDTADLTSGWKRLADCPGTPRMVAATAAVDDKIFVIGGATGGDNPSHPGGTNTVVDNWRYDPEKNQWERLRDLPVASGNFPSGQIVYKNRYILLIGGYQYSDIENPDGSLRKPYGVPYQHYKKGEFPWWAITNDYFSDVWVYDTQTGLFGTATPLPLNNNMPMVVLNDSRIYLIGGETGGSVIEGEPFGHYPELLLVGSIE